MKIFKMLLVLCFLLFHFIPSFNTLQTILPGQSIKDNETLISKNEFFEAGFFNFGDTNIQYFGIWYKKISPKTIVWIANRDTPLENSSRVLNFTDEGTLFIVDSTKGIVWSSNTSKKTIKKPILQLLENGNLVVKNENNPDDFLWQSFDLPGDTLLPSMRIRTNKVTGEYTGLVSWKNTQDPSTGLYSYHIDINGFPQVVITKGNTILFRIGSWNGNILSGIPSDTLFKSFNYSFVITDKEVSYGFELLNEAIVSRYMLSSTGQVTRYMLSDRTMISWNIFFVGPSDQCDNYAICGDNSNCDVGNSPMCECLKGFVPKTQENGNFGGCIRKVNLDCDGNSDGFLKLVVVKLPDTSRSWFDKNMNLEECEKFCLRNCSCTAYANLDIRDGGSGCLVWFNNIVDVRKLSSGGQDLYIRVAASELGANTLFPILLFLIFLFHLNTEVKYVNSRPY